MTPRTKWILIILVGMILVLVVVGIAYITTRQAIRGPDGAPKPPEVDQVQTAPKIGQFSLGEFIATSRDEELHYIKIEVVIGYVGNLEQELEERKAELRDAIITILMRMTIAQAKEDYIDHFLHRAIEKRLNEVLDRSTSDSRIVRVFIPSFLIN